MKVYPTAQDEAMKLLQDMKAVFAPGSPMLARLRQNIDRFTSEIETLKYGNELAAADVENPWPEIHFTAAELQYLLVLKRAGDRGMEKNGLLTVLYAGRPDNSWPEIKIVDVLASKVRKKFYAAGMTSPIETIWGRGYRFREPVKATDFATTYAFERGEDGMTVGSAQATRRDPEKADFSAAAKARNAHGIWKRKPKESIAA